MTAGRRALDVVMCTYHNERTLPDVLDRLAGLHDALDLRLVVCDNASQDGTTGLLDRYAAEHPTLVLRSDGNVGFGKAVNRCLAERRSGVAVLVLNPDVVLGPAEDLGVLLADLAQDGVGVVSPLLVTADGAVDHACARPEPTPLQTLVYVLGLTGAAQRLRPGRAWYGTVPASPGPVDSCSGAFMLLRPEALHGVGGFDEQFWMYAEDLDLCRRLRAAGWRVWFDPRVRALHLKGASTEGGWSGPTHYWFFESMRRYYAKWYSGSLLGRLGNAPLALLSRVWSHAVARRDVKSTRPWR